MTSLVVFVDPLRLASVLAVKPTLAMLAQCPAEVTWLPMRAPKEFRQPPALTDTVRERHQRVRQAYRDHDNARYAAWQGLPAGMPACQVDRDLLDYALLLLSRDAKAPGLLLEVARHWFGSSTVPIDAQWLVAASGCTDLQLNYSREGNSTLVAHWALVADLGIFDAPAFLAGDHLFIGRQHLPAIETLLTGGTPFPTN
ncbi:MAG: hypothetical protein H6993_07925 [Pseudomonadales bacterium]|nr:hypothetical protein [Pseudomonadales bacterium]